MVATIVPQRKYRYFTMAFAHNNLFGRTHQSPDVSSRFALFMVILSVVCGTSSFILCLAAEALRTEETWYGMNDPSDSGDANFCAYTGSGRTPVVAAVCAFTLLAVAMYAEHTYMSVLHTRPGTPTASTKATALTWQACCLFFTAWISFGTAEVLLIAGIGKESEYLSQWTKERPDCHVVLPGHFASAGIFGLITVLLGLGMYLTALQTQKLQLEEEYIRRRMQLATIHLYSELAP